MSPALAGVFLTTAPPGKSLFKFLFIYLFIFKFLLDYTVVLVSGVQQSESVVHIHISTLFLESFPI